MKKVFKLTANLSVAMLILFLSGCTNDHDLYQRPEELPKKEFFDFSMTQTISVNIDYCLADYAILFEIYDQNPVDEQENGTWIKKDIEPLYRAATGKDGKYTGKISLPAYVSQIWLYSEYLGAISPVNIEITDNTLTFNQRNFIDQAGAKTRAVTSGGFSYPDNYLTLGNWDLKGKPDYMLPQLSQPAAAILYDIKNTYRKAGDYTITENHKEFFDGSMNSDISIIKPTKINLVFLSSSASWNNTVGYYIYPTGKKPANASEVKKIIAFPNASPLYYNGKLKGSLLCGNQVQLKYWDGEKFQDEFPAGVTIGWFLQGMGFKDGNIVTGQGTRYSTRNLNDNNIQRTVSLLDPASGQIVSIGFEDNSDYDYCDATFYLDIEQKDAIDDSTLPDLPDTGGPTENDNYTTYYGTLTFEDQWPAQGDYDMNDVMVDYNCKVYKTIVGNKVIRIIDEFIPRDNNGGTYSNGFGYQLHGLSDGDIRNITIDGPVHSTFMNGNTREDGQNYPTIILFDNIKNVMNKKFTVTLELNDVENTMAIPPYNPFIISKADEGRGREVHLVNYPPTAKADPAYFGTGFDVSRPAEHLYYVSKDMMPFAINLAQIKDFPIPAEGVRIDQAYPYFTQWAKSFGKDYKDWYKKK